MMDENTRHQKRIAALMKERIAVVPYDPEWPQRYADLEVRLRKVLPKNLVQRIAHIGSTAVPGLSAKPIIDVQVEVNDMQEVRERVVPMMEELGYEFIWRPSIGENEPFYAWFIKRNAQGDRTEHIHIVAPDHISAERIIFRDILRRHPEEAAAYEALKAGLAKKHAKDRAAYTLGKTAFIQATLRKGRDGSLR
ncbi:MAG: GrpB family protein [Flavobacteriales bacterium]|nr:GrpB family protein [Flavobacteriales bacterium]